MEGDAARLNADQRDRFRRIVRDVLADGRRDIPDGLRDAVAFEHGFVFRFVVVHAYGFLFDACAAVSPESGAHGMCVSVRGRYARAETGLFTITPIR